MKFENKLQILKQLGTAKLWLDIQEQENKLQELMVADAQYRSENVKYLASYTDDCTEVKALLADLSLEAPFGPDGKKLTVAQLESWLRQQRTGNPQLKEAIQTQHRVAFTVESNRIELEMAKKRLESLKGMFALRTAQIMFLKEG